MNQNKNYFFCGIGGSGMLPLAMILRTQGHKVEGSDRSLDQGQTPEKFQYLRMHGICLFPQNGSGLNRSDQILVASAAVEETVPDVAAASRVGASRITRAALLADLFNGAAQSIAVGGTSGKSTTTGMIGWILSEAGQGPTIVNGAVMKNFVTPDEPFASAVSGNSNFFVSEVDESDGSIALFNPRIAVLNNIAFDHKPLDELRALFHDFVNEAETAVLNLDNDETAAIAEKLAAGSAHTYSLQDTSADFFADDLVPEADGTAFTVTEKASGETVAVKLPMPGAHNVANALAAVTAARACHVSLQEAASALGTFAGIRRRLELVGTSNGVTVVDDFGHNPDKIAATLSSLHDFRGRLLVMFQPHGFGPLALLKDAFIDCFAKGLDGDDVLIMPEPIYYGGTVERKVSSNDIARAVHSGGRHAYAFADREACGDKLIELARPGDRIIVMGARDDTLSTFAAKLLPRLASS